MARKYTNVHYEDGGRGATKAWARPRGFGAGTISKPK